MKILENKVYKQMQFDNVFTLKDWILHMARYEVLNKRMVIWLQKPAGHAVSIEIDKSNNNYSAKVTWGNRVYGDFKFDTKQLLDWVKTQR